VSKVDEIKAYMLKPVNSRGYNCFGCGSVLDNLEELINAVRQEERDRIDTLLREYEVHDFTSCYGGEPTWIVALKGDDLSGSHTLYSRPINALLSKETK
jgi:hypothetical protein